MLGFIRKGFSVSIDSRAHRMAERIWGYLFLRQLKDAITEFREYHIL
jgi:hypothetical protein